MILDRLIRTEQNARRLAEIVGVLAKYGLADWLGSIRHTEWFRRHLTPTGFQRIAKESHEARIRLEIWCGEKLRRALERQLAYLEAETLATAVVLHDLGAPGGALEAAAGEEAFRVEITA